MKEMKFGESSHMVCVRGARYTGIIKIINIYSIFVSPAQLILLLLKQDTRLASVTFSLYEM